MLSSNAIVDDSPDCLNGSIATVAKSICTCQEEMIGAGAWWFSLKDARREQEDVIWNQICYIRYDAWKPLEDYYGVIVKWTEADSPEEVLQVVQGELRKERPVLIYIDTHFCPWHPRQNEYNSHFCLVVGYDEEKQEFICNDVNPEKYHQRLPYQLFAQGYGPYITFSKSDQPCRKLDWKEIIADTLNRLGFNESVSSFDLMRKLSSEVLSEINELPSGVPSWIQNPVQLILRTGLLQKGRNYYASTLKYLAKEFQVSELETIADRLNEASQQWNVVAFLAVKSKAIQDDRRALLRIPEKILEVADFEEKIANDLVEILDKYK